MSTIHHFALRYAGAGFRVLPLRSIEATEAAA